MSLQRILPYSLAINDALHQMMAGDPAVFIIGQGVKSPWYVGKTAQGLLDRFGDKRVIDTPVSENAMTGSAVGAAIAGMKPIVVHPRMDFMFYALDPIINEAANWHYMNGGRSSVPVVFWGIINRGGEQAAQHSQALHSLFSHIPGLKVVMPSTAYDAKGLMIAAIQDPNPVVFVDDRWLHNVEDYVPEEIYSIDIGKGIVRQEGTDVTIVAISSMVRGSIEASFVLAEQGISAEVIDLRSAKPLDKDLIITSVQKTGRLVVVDPGWKTCGLASEVCAIVAEHGIPLRAAPIRIALPDCPAPASRHLESAYYKNSANIIQAVERTFRDN